MNRAFEAVVATAGLIVLSPVILVCMIAVRLDSPGPAILTQQRVGQGERVFRCHKLRTMVAGTATLPTHLVSAAQITRVGTFLRRTKLDELPQLLNIIRGEMSFVGPRPCLPTQSELIEERRRRGVFAVRPGLTGLAQVQNIDMSNPPYLAEVDAKYLATRTFTGDLSIIVRTVFGGGNRGTSRG
jgi:O-antigen biosynthesis protein WbqP